MDVAPLAGCQGFQTLRQRLLCGVGGAVRKPGQLRQLRIDAALHGGMAMANNEDAVAAREIEITAASVVAHLTIGGFCLDLAAGNPVQLGGRRTPVFFTGVQQLLAINGCGRHGMLS